MSKYQRSFIRKVLATSHKLLLNRAIDSILGEIEGDVLVIGAGKEPYRYAIPKADSLLCTDIAPGRGIDLIVDAHSIPFQDSSYDFVIAIEVYEHLQNPVRASGEMLRVLREGGEVLVTVPFMFRIHGDPYDYNRFTEWGIRELFKDFSVVNVYPFGNRIQVISDIVTTIARPIAVLRVVNHLLCVRPLARPSLDCPSGYVVRLKK